MMLFKSFSGVGGSTFVVHPPHVASKERQAY